ncbi:metallophosphoesterase [Halarcobacter bivalviorum]|uniref:Metallophosphoesterase (YkuE domain) n=1 Tax=Halarcobacter bivalviorum TaxID=663364 RepID=A0AAX2A9P5_9BACT|nr:metallophosphoesterase [Halarcobacter bivalviorum]AXH13607.1 metallophosphoesterase (YkuE domain) [Halarcobacter bivalviorum]RXK09788.1 serine/threonine protein phosphatase [Halarcobacter bivalviorum]
MRLPELEIKNLKVKSENLQGLQILHLSDLHINKKTKVMNIEKLVAFCNSLEYDFLALTGDIIDCKVDKIIPQLKALNSLKKVFYISGNHDLFYGIKGLKELLTNFTFLDNKTTFIKYQNRDIALAGISDRFSKFFKIKREEKKILSFLKSNEDSILLAHQPKDYSLAIASNTKLFLCGHTHGGQVFPFHYFVRLFQPFLAGIFYKKDTCIYVNRGLGTWGIDFRYKANSEITLLKLINN